MQPVPLGFHQHPNAGERGPDLSSHTSNLPAMPHPFTRCWELGRHQHPLNESGEGAAAIRERLEPPGHSLGMLCFTDE
jgi:hypothetical protein